MSDVGPVLVTGACGQIGKRCVEILLSRGRTVVATDLRNDKTVAIAHDLANRTSPGTLHVVFADLTDAAAVAEMVSRHRPTAIVHLAAMLAPVSYRNPRLARTINVEGTRNLVTAARTVDETPLFVTASSAAVYGSRNPHRHPERITPDTPVNPVDQYGEDKVLAEAVVRDSGLPYAVLRLAGVISPDGAGLINSDVLLLMRATPGDNRMHTVDARDVALAFANAAERRDTVNGKVLLIAGDDTHLHSHRELEDDMMEAAGIGRLGPSASLPGDPDDDRGWAFTGFFDTTESQAVLAFQEHTWAETVAWVADSMRRQRAVLRVLGPLIRPAMRLILALQRKIERRGRYAEPWSLVEKRYGPEVLAGGQARSGAEELQ